MISFLKSKKGFTLVELMIVLVLLGLGAFALINIFRVAYRSFNKTEERYIKQEAVKTVADYFQKNKSLSAANKVEMYNTLDVLPTGIDQTYNYIYVDPDTGFLYIRPAGDNKATQLTDIKLYICFNEIPYNSLDVTDDYEHSRGVYCYIAAVEDEFKYKDDSGKNVILARGSDDVYYSLDVSYHFANMVENGEYYVNRVKTSNGYEKSKTGVVKNGSSTQVLSSDTNAFVVKYVSDMVLSGDELLNETNLNLYCFIASASYGVNNGDGTVGLLCDFRDNCLLTNAPGRLFVKAYYAISPPIADFIAQHETLRATVRTMLKPLVVVAEYSLNHELISEVAPTFLLAFALGLPLSAVAVHLNKKRRREE